MIYKGGCHCGRIAFEVEGNIRRLENVELSALKSMPVDGRKS